MTRSSAKSILSKASPILKILLAAAIVTWMASSGKLNFAQVAHSLAKWPLMLGIVALAYAQMAISSARWKLLLDAQEIRLPYGRVCGLTMIGMLFNVAIPGAVGGDLVKGYYIARAAPRRKSHSATTILMDRVAGLIGLLFLGSAGVLLNLDETMRTAATRSLGLMTVGGMAGGLAGLYAAIFMGERLAEWRRLPGVLRNVFGALHEYRRNMVAVPLALALSVANQAGTCAMLYLALRSTGVTDMPAGQFFLVAPLAMVTTAIPVSPGGIGVGQAAFFTLFQIVAPRYAAPGADAVTVMQVMFILVCLTGLFWYLPYKHVELETGEKNSMTP